MLSRVADSVYWMNRQIERAENIARATETTLDLALEGTVDHGRLWNALVCAFGDQADDPVAAAQGRHLVLELHLDQGFDLDALHPPCAGYHVRTA